VSLPILAERGNVDLMVALDIDFSNTDTLAGRFDGPRVLNDEWILLIAVNTADYRSASEGREINLGEK